MKKIFFLPFLLFFLISCSDESLLLEKTENSIIETRDDDFGDFAQGCVGKCWSKMYQCFGMASEDRVHALMDCQAMLIIGTETVFDTCTRTVVVGTETVVTGDGETLEFPIYEEEEYICEEVVNVYADLENDPELEAAYNACVQQAQLDFADAIEECEVKLTMCMTDCNKPKPNTGGIF